MDFGGRGAETPKAEIKKESFGEAIWNLVAGASAQDVEILEDYIKLPPQRGISNEAMALQQKHHLAFDDMDKKLEEIRRRFKRSYESLNREIKIALETHKRSPPF